MSEITEVVTSSRPIIVEFQNQSPHNDNLKSAIFKDSKDHKRVVGISNDRVVYSGIVGDNDDDLYNNFLGFYDEHTQQIKLVQFDTCSVVPLIDKKLSVTKSPVNEKSVADLRRQFGSKKAKRYTEQQERLTMNIENVKEELEQTVSGIDVSELNTSATVIEEDGGYRPRINREASTKEQVYQMDDLVPSEVLDSLNERASEIVATDELAGYGLVPFCAQSIAILKVTSTSDEDKLRKCQIFLYLNYLAKYATTPLKSMTRKHVTCDCSHLVDQHIKNTFSINGHRPNSMRDKILCYTLVLFVIAKDYEADIESLAKDLKVGVKKMMEFARVLAFTSSSSKKSTILLKLPLPPLVMPFAKRKRN